MNELVALLVVGMALFILGSVFGLTVYHLILRLVRKGESEVKAMADGAKAYAEKILAEAYKKAAAIEQDVKDGLPHA